MHDHELNGESNLVRYTLVTTARGRERMLKTDRTVVRERMSGQAFVNQVITDYFSASAAARLGPEEMKALHVDYEVLERWPRPTFEYEEEQVEVLEEIRDALAAPPEPSQAKPQPSQAETPAAKAPSTPLEELAALGLGAGLAMWVRSDQVTASGGRVSSWTDLSENGRPAAMSEASQQPELVDGVFGPHPAVRFAGSQWLEFTGDFLAGSDYTVFAVTARRSAKDNNYPIGGTDTGTNKLLHLGYRSNTQVRMAHYGNDIDIDVPPWSQPSIDLFTFRFSQATGKAVYHFGVEQGKKEQKDPLSSFDGAMIGRFATTNFEGDIAEILVYDQALDENRREAVEHYLRRRYGLLRPDKAPALELGGAEADIVHLSPDLFAAVDQEVTVEAWLRPAKGVGEIGTLFFYGPAAGKPYIMNIHFTYQKTLSWDTGPGTGGRDRVSKGLSSEDFGQGEWNHWAFTKNAASGEARIYRNGALFTSKSGLSLRMNGTGWAGAIGACGRDGENKPLKWLWQGQIVEFRIWNVERSAEQIAVAMHRELPAGSDPALIFKAEP